MEEAQYSNTFFEITYQCLAEIPSARPTLELVIKSLEKALHSQVSKSLKLKSLKRRILELILIFIFYGIPQS